MACTCFKMGGTAILGLASTIGILWRIFTKLLHHLTKIIQFEWSQASQAAFAELRSRLPSAPVLAFPDYNQSFILDTDTNEHGIWALLSQHHNNESERPLLMTAESLRAQNVDTVTRKELLPMITFVQQIRPYQLGREIQLRTEHGSWDGWPISRSQKGSLLTGWSNFKNFSSTSSIVLERTIQTQTPF